MTVIANDKNELIPTRTIIGWRVCIDYRKLNDATRKDHFLLPFIDQMLERLAGHSYLGGRRRAMGFEEKLLSAKMYAFEKQIEELDAVRARQYHSKQLNQWGLSAQDVFARFMMNAGEELEAMNTNLSAEDVFARFMMNADAELEAMNTAIFNTQQSLQSMENKMGESSNILTKLLRTIEDIYENDTRKEENKGEFVVEVGIEVLEVEEAINVPPIPFE
ncbi:uncharacterized protein LOC120278551 [Dioscorea cayenensis subsp. rotundata]|uniref:Uncharacterized protein LOC120278551 n=1 Tax=Dioscorea cayennensis subsp. rotundata TaxID=55577 RepID=A0AB40CMM2_DIOCR|nr:uncharacterized protein LOC120278551 [Dioscorea cayenensis subsp. rotundata]